MVEENDCCEHFTADASKLVVVSYENDSFGREGYGSCQECYDKSLAVVEEETHTCTDCKKSVPLKDGLMWKWYDFYAPQGDEPLFVCNECRKLEKHRERLAKDARDYEWEFGADWE